jgi:ABC-type glycerol-3-phosphate transport system substrate-binding protein
VFELASQRRKPIQQRTQPLQRAGARVPGNAPGLGQAVQQGQSEGRKPGAWQRLALGLGLALTLGLQGCQWHLPWKRETLIIYVVPPGSSTLTQFDINNFWNPLIAAYKRLHPGVHLNYNFVVFESQQLKKELRRRNSRGLGPDILIVNAATALELLDQGLIDKVQVSTDIQNSIQPWVLSRVQVKGGLAALPIALEPQLSCYNRSRIPDPPATLEALLQLAAQGKSIGLSVSPINIWWTIGPLGADGPLQALMEAPAGRPPAMDGKDRAKITAWLAWLRDAARQSHVNFFNNDEELLTGLSNGQLDWISCLSFNLPRLQAKMGSNLAVASLPQGPDGQATPNSLLRVIAFGVNSSPCNASVPWNWEFCNSAP